MPKMPGQKPEAGPDVGGGDNESVVASAMLRSFVDRVEALLADRKAINQDVKEVYDEADGKGLSKKAIRAVIRDRAKDQAKLKAETQLYMLYREALGEPDVFG